MRCELLAVSALVLVAAAALLSAITTIAEPSVRPLPGGWGVDACLSVHVPPEDVAGYLGLLGETRIRWLRERDIGGQARGTGERALSSRERRLEVWRQLKAAGFRVLAFASLPEPASPEDPDNQLPEDLLAVFEQSRQLAMLAGGNVDAWETCGEPDTAYMKDLPDRVAAYDKAVYLGLKAGSGSRTVGVLMGALGLPPGPWLERAARNGLYDYTDGLNFHFYGHASDLDGVIEAQRNYARFYTAGRSLPLWITECGLDAAPLSRLDDAPGREHQRAFTLETSLIARAAGVEVFMPFILVYPGGSGFSLTASARKPYPAWNTYSRLTREYSLRAQPALSPPESPNPIVLQWMPDNSTCVPHKVSGVYWFLEGEEGMEPLKGEIIAYNFSRKPARGRLEIRMAKSIRMKAGGGKKFPSEIEIPPFGSVRLPVSFEAEPARYARGEVEMSFSEKGGTKPSRLMFGLETRPSEKFLSRELPLDARFPGGDFSWILAPEPFRVTSRCSPWLGINGVAVGPGKAKSGDGDAGNRWSFRLNEALSDPRAVPMAIAKVNGLPDVPEGFLRLRFSNEVAARNVEIRVDLVDRQGQRFSISDHVGQNMIDPTPGETFLAYRDFHPYFWGRCTPSPVFHPEDVREIQLRFYFQNSVKAIDASLDVVALGVDIP